MPLPLLRQNSQRPGEATVWTCILAAIAVVLALGTGTAIYDVRGAVADRRTQEIQRLRSHAERSAAQMESQLADAGPRVDLEAATDARWLRNYWRYNVPRQPGRVYAAITDRHGEIIAHTRLESEGRRAATASGVLPESLPPDGVVLMRDPALTTGRAAWNIEVPIRVGGKVLGLYHAGMDAGWLDARLDEERRVRVVFWIGLVAGMCCVVLLSSVMIVRVTRQTSQLEHELDVANVRRTTEIHELVLGIAHEIRNPLNAIRLNLHTIDQVCRRAAVLPAEEVESMLSETASEIDRMEELMREMLGFARAQPQEAEPVELLAEVQRTVGFLKQKLDDSGVSVHVEAPQGPASVAMNRTRLRQVLLNLLNNACEALGSGGNIDIVIRQQRERVELLVTDDGPGIPPPDRERVFVPFYSTKPAGTGLGLALARKHIEEAGGQIVCEATPDGKGCQFRLTLPVMAGALQEVAR